MSPVVTSLSNYVYSHMLISMNVNKESANTTHRPKPVQKKSGKVFFPVGYFCLYAQAPRPFLTVLLRERVVSLETKEKKKILPF